MGINWDYESEAFRLVFLEWQGESACFLQVRTGEYSQLLGWIGFRSRLVSLSFVDCVVNIRSFGLRVLDTDLSLRS